MATSRPIESPCRNDATGRPRQNNTTSCPTSRRSKIGSAMSTNCPSVVVAMRGHRRTSQAERVKDPGTSSGVGRAQFLAVLGKAPARCQDLRVWYLLHDGARTCANTKTGRTCQKLLDHFDALWTFVYRDGIEPTNNNAERALRHAVILRKLCYGSHSPEGSRFTAGMLTCHATLRHQGRNVLAFLTEACRAALAGTEPPS